MVLTFIVHAIAGNHLFFNVDDRVACLSKVDFDTWGLGDYKN